MTTVQNKIIDDDFPSLFQVADESSKKSQKYYTNLVKADLILMAVGALLSTVSVADPNITQWMNILGAVLLLAAFSISLGLRYSRYENTWYGARAVAESVKTISWRYMTRASPFVTTLTASDADLMLAGRLKEILAERDKLAVSFSTGIADQISVRMKEVRSLGFSERKELYLRDRIQEQRGWYSGKAQANRKSEQKFYWTAIGFQFIAFGLACYQIKNSEAVNFSGVLATGTTAIFSWMQIRKFQELAQIYSLTAEELGLAYAESVAAVDDESLSEFVADSESAISREHTLWVARREQ